MESTASKDTGLWAAPGVWAEARLVTTIQPTTKTGRPTEESENRTSGEVGGHHMMQDMEAGS